MTDRRSDSDDRVPGDDRELAALVEELSTTLESLRDALAAEARGREVGTGRPGPVPPTPPAPRELLRFTEQYTIPTLIALLESGVRSLELLRATLRLLDGRGIENASPATRERVESAGRSTLDRVDRVLSDLGSAVEGGEPSDPTARDLLADARALREEIERQLREADDGGRGHARERDWDGTARRTSGRAPAEGREIPVRSAADRSDESPTDEGDGADDGDDDDVPVDVDAELESIRRDVKGEAGGGSSDSAASDAEDDTGDGAAEERDDEGE
jgi:hypothetical protein